MIQSGPHHQKKVASVNGTMLCFPLSLIYSHINLSGNIWVWYHTATSTGIFLFACTVLALCGTNTEKRTASLGLMYTFYFISIKLANMGKLLTAHDLFW